MLCLLSQGGCDTPLSPALQTTPGPHLSPVGSSDMGRSTVTVTLERTVQGTHVEGGWMVVWPQKPCRSEGS